MERRLARVLVLAGAAFALLVKLGVVAASAFVVPWVCPFRLVTGLPCPG